LGEGTSGVFNKKGLIEGGFVPKITKNVLIIHGLLVYYIIFFNPPRCYGTFLMQININKYIRDTLL
jgi:hypothetical protein